jgi:hypothetical protein
MGSQLLDLVAQKQADTQRAGDDARTIKQQIMVLHQRGMRPPMQVRDCEIGLAHSDEGYQPPSTTLASTFQFHHSSKVVCS